MKRVLPMVFVVAPVAFAQDVLPAPYPELTTHVAPKALADDAVTEDWPSFLGPRRDAHTRETRLLRDWPEGGPTLLWEMESGQGYAAPVVQGERLVYAHRTGSELHVDCLHAETGERYWRHSVTTDYRDRYISNHGPRSAPTIDGDRVFVHQVDDRLQCLALATGELLWERNLGVEYKVPAEFFGVVASPLVAGDLVIQNVGAPGGPSVVAFDRLTGDNVWSVGTKWGPSCASPVLATTRGQERIFVLAGGDSRPPTGGLMVIDPVSGALDFEYPFRSRIYESVTGASPVIADDRIFITASYGTGTVGISATAEGGFEELWKNRHIGMQFSNPVYEGGQLVAIDGVSGRAGALITIDPATGEELSRTNLDWDETLMEDGEEKTVSFSVGEGSLLAADGDFLCLGDYGHLLWVEASSEGARVINRATLFRAAESWTPPVVSRGLLYVRQNNRESYGDKPPRLLCYDLRGEVPETRASETWSRFRGPNGNGVADSPGLPTRFGQDENVLWKKAVPAGKSSPILTDDRIFLTAEEDGELLTLAYDRATGAELWRAVAPRERVSKVDARNHAAAASVAIAPEAVIAFFQDYGVLAYDHNGHELWRRALGPFNNVYGMGASPIIHGDRVFLPCDQQTGSFVIAFALDDGEELWRVERPEAKSGHCTPILYTPDGGGTQLLLPGSFLLDAYDVATGDKVWWSRGLCFEMKSVPVLHDGVVYVNGFGSPMNNPGNQVEVESFDDVIAAKDADSDGRVDRPEMPEGRAASWFDFVDLEADGELDRRDWEYLRAALASQNGMLAIRAGGVGDRTAEASVWNYRRSVPQLPSPLIYRDVLYMLNDQGGLITTFHPATGEVIERGRLADAQDNYYASPVAGDGKVYLVSEGGIVTVLPPGGGLEPLATIELEESVYATPALSGGKVFLRTDSHLYCFGQ